MATLLVYNIAAYQPFTKILSASINQDKTDIQNRLNWAGGTSATTGLGDDNLQSNTASGGGLTRATKLKLGTAYAFVVNSVTGALTEVVSAANQTIYTSGTGVPTAGVLPLIAGGTGSALSLGSSNVGDTLQVQAGGTTVAFGTPPTPPTSRVFNFYQFS